MKWDRIDSWDQIRSKLAFRGEHDETAERQQSQTRDYATTPMTPPSGRLVNSRNGQGALLAQDSRR